MIFAGPSQETALAALWSYYLTAGLDAEICPHLLDHPAEYIRAWTIRLLGDDGQIAESLQPRLVELAAGDPSPIVHCQLAATARRLPGAQALPIIAGLVGHGEDMDDKFIPLMTWWAVENKAVSDREAMLALMTAGDKKTLPMVRTTIVPRLARRYTAEHNEAGFDSVARLLDAAPTKADSDVLIAAVDQELAGQSVANIPAALKQSLERLLAVDPPPAPLVRLGLRLGHKGAYARAMATVNNRQAPEAERLQLIQTVGETSGNAASADLLKLLAERPSPAVATALLGPGAVGSQRSSRRDSEALSRAKRAAQGAGDRPVVQPQDLDAGAAGSDRQGGLAPLGPLVVAAAADRAQLHSRNRRPGGKALGKDPAGFQCRSAAASRRVASRSKPRPAWPPTARRSS